MSNDFNGDIVVPDVAEPIRAFRCWNVGDLRLVSTNADMEWQPGVNHAACNRNVYWQPSYETKPPPPTHTPAITDCTCGFYAFKDREYQYLASYDGEVYGEVLLWGSVVEGEKGYRAEYAQVVTLYGSGGEGTRTMKLLGEVYDCAVVKTPELDMKRLNKYRKAMYGPRETTTLTSVFQTAMQSLRTTMQPSFVQGVQNFPISSLPSVATTGSITTNAPMTIKRGASGHVLPPNWPPPNTTLNTRTNQFEDPDGFSTTNGYIWRKRYD